MVELIAPPSDFLRQFPLLETFMLPGYFPVEIACGLGGRTYRINGSMDDV